MRSTPTLVVSPDGYKIGTHRGEITDDQLAPSLERAIVGNGDVGFTDGAVREAQFWEPGRIATSSDGAYTFVTDTKNHALRSVDLSCRVRTITLTGRSHSPGDLRRRRIAYARIENREGRRPQAIVCR